MEAPVGDGTRATLARDAAKSTLSLVPGNYALGLWAFAYQLEGSQDWAELVPTRELDADVDGRPQRDVLDEELDTLPDRLTPRRHRAVRHDPGGGPRCARRLRPHGREQRRCVVTDGKDDDDAGVELGPLLATLRSEADPDRPVKVIGVALGPGRRPDGPPADRRRDGWRRLLRGRPGGPAPRALRRPPPARLRLCTLSSAGTTPRPGAVPSAAEPLRQCLRGALRPHSADRTGRSSSASTTSSTVMRASAGSSVVPHGSPVPPCTSPCQSTTCCGARRRPPQRG